MGQIARAGQDRPASHAEGNSTMHACLTAIRHHHEQGAAASDANHTLVLTALTFAEQLDLTTGTPSPCATCSAS